MIRNRRWAQAWEHDSTHHWHDCTAKYCPISDNSQKSGYAEHAFDRKVGSDEFAASPATCTAPATYYFSCVCGAAGTETFVGGEALGHDYRAIVTEPNCTEGGCTTHTCSRCGDSYTDAETPALGHAAKRVAAKAPTATEQGNIAYWHCSRCGRYFKDAALMQEITRGRTVLAATGEGPGSEKPGKSDGDVGETGSGTPKGGSGDGAAALPQTGDGNGALLRAVPLAVAGGALLVVGGCALRSRRRSGGR